MPFESKIVLSSSTATAIVRTIPCYLLCTHQSLFGKRSRLRVHENHEQSRPAPNLRALCGVHETAGSLPYHCGKRTLEFHSIAWFLLADRGLVLVLLFSLKDLTSYMASSRSYSHTKCALIPICFYKPVASCKLQHRQRPLAVLSVSHWLKNGECIHREADESQCRGKDLERLRLTPLAWG